MIEAAGREWITAAEIPARWPDVTANTVRCWAYDGKVTGYRIGRQVYYDLAQLTEIEHATRTSRRGHKRGHATTPARALQS